MSNNMPLAESFSNSIKEESFSCLAEIAEATLIPSQMTDL